MLVPYQSWDLFLLSCANRATHLFRRHEHYTETHYRKLLSFENTKLQEKNSQGCNAVIQEACASRNMCERNRTNMRSTKHGWTHPSKCPLKQAKSAKFPHLVGCWKADVLTFCDDWGKMRRSELLTDSPSRCSPLTSESAGACSSAGGWAGGWMAGGSFS